jgi:hypothetical protein
MKLYTIEKLKSGRIAVMVETDIVKDAKGRRVFGYNSYQLPATRDGKTFYAGDQSEESLHLAEAILSDHKELAPAGLEGMQKSFLTSFISHHVMKPGNRYEISSEVIDRWAQVWREIPA